MFLGRIAKNRLLWIWGPPVAIFLSCQPVSWAGESGFLSFAEHFARAWDRKDHKALDSLLFPDVGLWIVYNQGVSPQPFRFSSVSSALSEGEFGFGNLKLVGFGSCGMSSGQPPLCSGDGHKAPLCQYGEAGDHFAELRDLILGNADASTRLLAAGEELRKATVNANIYFISDHQWGAAFYFVPIPDGWKLILIDTTDCSA